MSSIKINLLYNTINNVLKVVFPLITAPYVTRVLSPDDLGLYNFGLTYAQYFAMLALLGIPYYGSREIAKVRDDIGKTNRLFAELFTIALLNTLFLGIIYFLFVILLKQFEQSYIIFLLLSLILFCSPFNIDWFYKGIENFKHITIRSLAIKLLGLFLLFVFVRDKEDLYWYVTITVLSFILNDLWNFVIFYKKGYKVDIVLTGLKKHLRPLAYLFSSSLAVSIYTAFDTIMLGTLSNYKEVAFYSYAMHISKSIIMAITSLSAVAVPRVSYYLHNNMIKDVQSLIDKSFSFVVFISIPICLGLIIISPTLVPLFLGTSFSASVLPLQILSGLIIVIGLNNLTAVQCLVGHGYDKLFLMSVMVGAVVNPILNLLFIPTWGAVGASTASVIAELFVLFVSIYYVLRNTPIRIRIARDVSCAVLASSTFFVVYFLLNNRLHGWWMIVVFVLLSSFFYLFIQFYAKNQVLLALFDVIKNKSKSS